MDVHINCVTETMQSVSWNFSCDHSGRSTLPRVSLSILTLSLLVCTYLLSLSITAAAAGTAAGTAAQSPTDSTEISALEGVDAEVWQANPGPDPCEDNWRGVTCDGGSPRQHVIGVDLSGSYGIVPSQLFPNLESLPKLNSLSCADCGLFGNLSSAFGNLSSLSLLRSLDLSTNNFDGEIPNMFGNWPSLQYLSLAHNQLEGEVPADICSAKSLTVLMLEGNSLDGSIPPCLGNLSSLSKLNISYNDLSGSIPESLGQLKTLSELDLGVNCLTGPLPSSLLDLSNLTKLLLSGNALGGELPVDIHRMGKVEELGLDSNQFTGPIPISICSMQSLRKLRLFDNQLTGSIPQDIGNLTRLTILFLHANNLSGPLPMSLGNLELLEQLQLQGNRINGTLPGSILAGLKNIQSFYVHFNELEGEIPPEIFLLTSATNLSLGYNNFIGSIPIPRNSTELPFESLSKLQFLSICNNGLTGPIPGGMGLLDSLKFLDLSNNQLNGSIPSKLMYVIDSQLVQANLIFNNFNRSSWSTVRGGECLELVNATLNQQCQAPGLSKGLAINVGGPQFTSVKGEDFVAGYSFSSPLGFYGYRDEYSGNGTGASASSWVISEQGVVQDNSASVITTSSSPPTPGSLGSTMFDVQYSIMLPASYWNVFQTARLGGDSLSYTIGSLAAGDYVVDLFFAELDTTVFRSGQRVFSVYIQQELRYPSLDIFNITGGTGKPLILSFPVSISSGVIAVRLVGRGSWPATLEQMTIYHGPILSALNIYQVEKSNHTLVTVIAAAVGAGSLLGLAVLSGVSYILWRRRRNRANVYSWNNVGLLSFKYAELEAATDKFSEKNLLGQGAFGKVFKGVLPHGAVIAIKVLSIPNREALVECLQNELQVISTVRHRNLVGLIGCCLEKCPVLVCEYMPNGNLHDALFRESSPVSLSWSARCNIALDIARGLHYLHEEGVHKIIHRDVKPVNILLDSKLSARLADFGMARLLAEKEEMEVFTHVMGTRGYMAPEYALNGQLSDKVDVFSFGVVLLELVIGKRGTQSAISSTDQVHLRDWAWEMFTSGQCEEMIDKRLSEDHEMSEVMSLLKIAIWCTEYNQRQRPSMYQVILMLTKQIPVPPILLHRQGYDEELLDDSCPFRSARWKNLSFSSGDQETTLSLEFPLSHSENYENSNHEFVEGP